MSKQKRNIIAVILCLITLAVAVGIFFITNKASSQKDNKSEIVSSEVTSNVNIEDIEGDSKADNVSSTKSDIEFLEPDETKADKILEESKKNKDTSSESKPTNTASKTENETSKPVTESSEANSFEEGKKELENKALQYLIEHNIDPKTAGETGEVCQHCGKMLWNPDKYGDFIPGMPENYENSGYCLGTCGISFD